jgi:hypothetical protein
VEPGLILNLHVLLLFGHGPSCIHVSYRRQKAQGGMETAHQDLFLPRFFTSP